MVESREQYEAEMRNAIRWIMDGKPLNDLNNEQRHMLKECYDKRYIDGLVFEEMISGRIICEIQHEPRLTYDGVQFMYPQTPEVNSKVEVSLSDAEHKLQAEKERHDHAEAAATRKSDRKFNLFTTLLGALAGSLLTLLVEHFTEAVNFVKLIFR